MSDRDDRPKNPHTGQPLPPEALDAAAHGAGDVGDVGELPFAAVTAPPAATTAPPSPEGSGIAEAPITPAAAPGGAPSQQEMAVRSALETVMDPEIMLSVIDLGLIREVHLLPEKTFIRMMLTTPFCPYAPQLMADVKQATESVVPLPCEVEIMPDAWSPDLMPDPGLLGFSF